MCKRFHLLHTAQQDSRFLSLPPADDCGFDLSACRHCGHSYRVVVKRVQTAAEQFGSRCIAFVCKQHVEGNLVRGRVRFDRGPSWLSRCTLSDLQTQIEKVSVGSLRNRAGAKHLKQRKEKMRQILNKEPRSPSEQSSANSSICVSCSVS